MLPQMLHTENFIIELLNQINILSENLSTLWVNIDCCDEHYRCATSLYLLSILFQSFSIITDRGISAPVHVRKVVDVLNSAHKSFIFQLISTVKFRVQKGMTHN